MKYLQYTIQTVFFLTLTVFIYIPTVKAVEVHVNVTGTVYQVSSNTGFTVGDTIQFSFSYDNTATTIHYWSDGANQIGEFGAGDDQVLKTFNNASFDYYSDATFDFGSIFETLLNGTLPDKSNMLPFNYSFVNGNLPGHVGETNAIAYATNGRYALQGWDPEHIRAAASFIATDENSIPHYIHISQLSATVINQEP